jgi:type II secretory pathway component PulF
MAFTFAQKHLFYTEIAKMVEAGFGIREAGRAMLDTRLPAVQADLLRAMDRDLEAGKSITEAFGGEDRSITELERRIIGAGERGGRLAPAFQHLADYFGMLATARRDALQSMAYPLLLLHLGLFVGVLVPGLMAQSDFIEIVKRFVLALFALYAAVLIGWIGLNALLAAAPGKPGLDRVLNAIPVLGGARRALAMARFTKVYHSCLLAGLSMKETVETASRAAHSGVIAYAGRELVATLDEGGALGPKFVSCGAFPPAFARSYATAEESGSLDKDLARWSTVYQNDAARTVKTASNVVSKLVYFLVLLFVAWTVIRAYSGYYAELNELME